MFISDHGKNKFSIRNRSDLKIIETIEHDFGFLYCGLYYPDQKVVVLGTHKCLVEFDFEKMEITKHVDT